MKILLCLKDMKILLCLKGWQFEGEEIPISYFYKLRRERNELLWFESL